MATGSESRDTDGPALWLAAAARRWPDAPALTGPGRRTLSYRELHGAACRLAGGLCAAGAAPGRALVLAGLSAWDTVVALHAGLLAGIPLLPLDPALPPDHRDALVAASGARVALTAGTNVCPPGLTPIPFGDAAAGTPWNGAPPAPEAVQLIVGTSGSSGAPKGVMLSAANLTAAVRASRRRLPIEAADVWLACLPLCHIGGLSLPLRCVEAGATLRVHERFDVGAVGAELAAGGLTHISLVPAMLERLLNAGWAPSATLKAALIGGAALAEPLRRRGVAKGWPLYLSYGMSETASQIVTGAAAEGRDGTVGEPLPGFELQVWKGRLAVRGPAVMLGYANPQLRPGDGLTTGGWFVTRDRVALEGGRLSVLGRADDVLVSGGEKVHPAEVEQLLAGCPGIGAVAVSAVSDPAWGDRLVAFFTGPAAPTEVEAWARARLKGAWRPRDFQRLPALPLQGPGKLDRKRLRQLAETTAPR